MYAFDDGFEAAVSSDDCQVWSDELYRGNSPVAQVIYTAVEALLSRGCVLTLDALVEAADARLAFAGRYTFASPLKTKGVRRSSRLCNGCLEPMLTVLHESQLCAVLFRSSFGMRRLSRPMVWSC